MTFQDICQLPCADTDANCAMCRSDALQGRYAWDDIPLQSAAWTNLVLHLRPKVVRSTSTMIDTPCATAASSVAL